MEQETNKLYFYKGPVYVRGRLVETEYYDHEREENQFKAMHAIRDRYLHRNGLDPDNWTDVVFNISYLKVRD